jgi:alkylation response protein AidB-like acyl-CoA dehydrogenase
VRRAAEALKALEAGKASLPATSRLVYQAKCHNSQASVELGSTLFRLCGARATARKYDADMHWRNARTLTLHDNLDRQLTAIGRSVLGIADSSSFTR